MIKTIPIVFLLAFISVDVPLPAQSGCTDPQALNFNPLSTVNDGSCIYPFTFYSPGLLALLPETLEECSGLAYSNGSLWTHPDGGNPAILFSIDTLTGNILNEQTFSLLENIDWEDLAENKDYLYIGDFGNNFGNRTDLRVIRVSKSGLSTGNPDYDVISFTFSDQQNFDPALNAHNFDCEAFFFWNDSLHLFSKNWIDFKTRHYVLPAEPGEQVAWLRDSLDVQGQVTGADISEEGTVVLLGYQVNTGEAFLWLLFDYPFNQFFAGNKRRISLGSALTVSQPEGIVFNSNTSGYICAERLSFLPQKLFAFDIREWIQNPNSLHPVRENITLHIYPNPANQVLFIENSSIPFEKAIVSILSVSGQVCLEKPFSNEPISLSGLPPGPYIVRLRSDGFSGMSTFIKVE